MGKSTRCLGAFILTSPLKLNVALLPHYGRIQPNQKHPSSKTIPSTSFSHQGNINEDDAAAEFPPNSIHQRSRSTSDPDYEGGANGNEFAAGRENRRTRLHTELTKLGINPGEIKSHPEQFGTAALRTYNSFLMPKSKGALAVAESVSRAAVVANNISFLVREYKADREEWLRNVDKNREAKKDAVKHSITVVLDNVRSAENVGNILRLGEAAQVDSIRLCGE